MKDFPKMFSFVYLLIYWPWDSPLLGKWVLGRPACSEAALGAGPMDLECELWGWGLGWSGCSWGQQGGFARAACLGGWAYSWLQNVYKALTSSNKSISL